MQAYRPLRMLLLASAFDTVATAVSKQLRRLRADVEIVHASLEALAAASWTHRIGRTGTTSTVTLADGTVLGSAQGDLVIFNRLEYNPALLFTRMEAVDRDYARAEFYALLLSWLESLGDRVLNRPTPAGLAGPVLRQWAWIRLALAQHFAAYPCEATTSARRLHVDTPMVARAELLPIAAHPAFDMAGSDRPVAISPPPEEIVEVPVVGGEVIGDASGRLDTADRLACARLARAAQAELMTVRLARTSGSGPWLFLAANAQPGTLPDDAIDAVARRLLSLA